MNRTLKKEAVFQLFDYLSEKKIGVTIEGGGEPTLHEDFRKIVEYANKSGLPLGLITNGIIDSSHVANYFKWIRISIDASTPEEFLAEKNSDKFTKVISNIKKLCEIRDPQNTHVGVGYVLTNRNMNNLFNLIDSLNEIGVDYMYLRPVEEATELMPELDKLLQLKKRIIEYSNNSRLKFLYNIEERIIKNNDNLPCVAHSLTSIIHADGNVTLCEKRRHDPIILGNIYQQTFEQIWNSSIHRSTTKKLLNPENQIGCDVCRITSFNRVFFDVNKIHTKNFI